MRPSTAILKVGSALRRPMVARSGPTDGVAGDMPRVVQGAGGTASRYTHPGRSGMPPSPAAPITAAGRSGTRGAEDRHVPVRGSDALYLCDPFGTGTPDHVDNRHRPPRRCGPPGRSGGRPGPDRGGHAFAKHRPTTDRRTMVQACIHGATRGHVAWRRTWRPRSGGRRTTRVSSGPGVSRYTR